MGITQTRNSTKLKRDLTKEAIDLALKGEWDRATEVNRAILELFDDDVDAMNRLGKALMELGKYEEARQALDRVVGLNTITKKNLGRLAQLAAAPSPCKSGRKAAGTPQLFIAESGKSGTTVLHKPACARVAASVAPGDAVKLMVQGPALSVFTRDDEYLGAVEPKLGKRLMRLMSGGNQYTAAVIGVNDRRISVIMRETLRHPSLQGVCSFPSTSRNEQNIYLGEDVLRYVDDHEPEEGEDEGEGRVKEKEEGDRDDQWEE
ncbi:MAG: tetratricopeptide repeat protein [Dehalococcoidia bacterium]|nr:tetratricopeptide repeat protein [Dehalococcoidia bacterium]